jgi:formylmethanofuran dehydrogenase subunit E-like metal-binding protein
MNMASKIFALALLLVVIPGVVMAQSTIMEELGSKASKAAMEQLNFEKGDSNVLALTDAGYAQVGDLTTQGALKGITAETGVTEGDSNKESILRPDLPRMPAALMFFFRWRYA